MIKKLCKKILYRHKCDSNSYIVYLRKKGMKIGKNTKIYAPRNVVIDEQKPWLIEIGNNVQITDGVRILTHDYGWSVIKIKYGEICGSVGKVKIGNNVFIGMNTTILKNVSVGDNIIIGANSLVNKSITKEGVYAGNPAKFLMTLDDYYERRKNAQLDEAYGMAVNYYETYGYWPEEGIFREFFWLFSNNDEMNPSFKEVMELEGNYEFCKEKLIKHPAKFDGFDDFLSYMKERYDREK